MFAGTGTARAGHERAGGTNAPAAAAPADNDAETRPGGHSTGASADAADAGGTTFVPPLRPSLSADDKKDPAKVKTYNEAKKAFDDYTAQAKLEPLAVKLSDSVGHNRVAINFMWTLITGFLVMFMQAGFRARGDGFVPRQECRPHDGHELHDLSDGHAGLLRVRLRLHVRRHGRHRAPMGGIYGGLIPG